jgi:AraC-like DNA-binding protein
MSLQTFKPSPKLNAVVLRYEFIDFTADPEEEYSIQVLPGFDNGFIFTFYRDKPMVIQNEEMGFQILPTTNLIPPREIPAYNYDVKNVRAIRVLFHPGVLAGIYGIPLGYFSNNLVELGSALDKKLLVVEEQLAEAATPFTQIQIIEQYLLKMLRFQKLNVSLSSFLNRLLCRHGYGHSVEQIAGKLGLSSRHLNRLLYKEVGFSATAFIRVHRFQQILKYFYQQSSISLTQVAYQFDFYDQSHFIREFKRMGDQTPGNFLKKLGRESIYVSRMEDNINAVAIETDKHL